MNKFLIKAAGSSNGRTRDFESRYLGSIPGPAALIGNKNIVVRAPVPEQKESRLTTPVSALRFDKLTVGREITMVQL